MKVVIGSEVGYETRCVVARTTNKSLFFDLEEGDQVIYTGFNVEKDTKLAFKIDSIARKAFESCPECNLPKTEKNCMLKHDKEAQKLAGTWKVVHKIEKDNLIKIFFDKSNFVFAAVARPTDWYHDIFKILKDDDIVDLEGWRYKSRTTLRYLKVVE